MSLLASYLLKFTGRSLQIYFCHLLLVNGLKKQSLVRTGKIATLDKALVIGKLGNISEKELEELDKKLLQLFDIKIN